MSFPIDVQLEHRRRNHALEAAAHQRSPALVVVAVPGVEE